MPHQRVEDEPPPDSGSHGLTRRLAGPSSARSRRLSTAVRTGGIRTIPGVRFISARNGVPKLRPKKASRRRERAARLPLSWRRSSSSPPAPLSGLCHGCHSSLTPVCPPLPSPRPVSVSVGWSCLFSGGRNTPLFRAASRLSAHHAEHDSPPSLWRRDEPPLPDTAGRPTFPPPPLLQLRSQTADQYRVSTSERRPR